MQKKCPKKETILNYRAPIELPNKMRSDLSDVIANLIAEYPTMSINSAVDFANRLLESAQGKILQVGRPMTFNFARKSIGQKIIAIGENLKAANLDFVCKNISATTVIFDHWSKNGL